MYIDSLTQLSRAIDAAYEAAMVPGLVLIGVVLVIMAGAEIRAHVRQRRRRAARRTGTARQTRVKRARGAEA
jgi:TRAP-type mannitol/chloroaromatic compound transport system permease large subunit